MSNHEPTNLTRRKKFFMAPFLDNLSIIVPVAAGDSSWINLLLGLDTLSPQTEIIFSSSAPPAKAYQEKLKQFCENRPVHWIHSSPGRGKQLNNGAACSKRKNLWFVHADSLITKYTLNALETTLGNYPNTIVYFDLGFSDGSPLMNLNTIGGWFRSHILGLPFGDQGLCMSKDIFEKVGGFREDVRYGEDHLFVWQAKQKRVALKCTNKILLTSARKYCDQGWVNTTARHLGLTFRQAFPEYLRLMQTRVKGL